MKKKLLAILALIIAVGVVLIIAFWPRPPSYPSQINFRLKWLWYSGWAGELLAENENVWVEQGLKVKTRPGGFELDPIKLVASGEDQIGVAGADQVLMARMNGVPLSAFAVQYQKSPVGFVSMEGSGIRSIEDFRGKKIGVKYGTDVEPVYRALLAKAGLSSDDVTEIPVKFDLAPFFSGAIDIYPGYLTNDLLIPAEKGYDVNLIAAPDKGVSVYGNVYFCREDYLRDRPEQLLSFLDGLRLAWENALSGPPERIADLALMKNNGLDREHEIRVVQSLHPYVLPEGVVFGQMTDDEWKHLYTILRDQGVIDRAFDYRHAYSMEILRRLPNAN
jgi:NitT/TauT family transport system substrate-binding protein